MGVIQFHCVQLDYIKAYCSLKLKIHVIKLLEKFKHDHGKKKKDRSVII